MNNFSKLKAGAIVLVNFPFTDLSARKVRPALVLRDQQGEDLLLAPISTTVNASYEDYWIQAEDYKEAALPVQSCVRYRKLFTLSQRLVLKTCGSFTVAATSCLRQKVSDFVLGS